MAGMHVVREGDCFDPGMGLATLETASVDVAITDPPYAPKVHAVGLTRGPNARRPSSGFGFDAVTPEAMRAAARELARLVRRWILIFTDVESVGLWRDALVAEGLEYVRTGCWLKTRAAPQFSGDRPAAGFEAIAIAHGAGAKRWNGGGRAGVWSFPVCIPPERVHPTQKPLGLLEMLVRDFSERGELVLDPFCGSGTTAVACRRLGRRFLGWERNGGFVAVAQRRLAATSEQLALPATGGERMPLALELPLPPHDADPLGAPPGDTSV